MIAANNRNNVEGALLATFNYWLQTSETASWMEVIHALRKVQENSLASRIEQKYTACNNK